MRVTCTDCTVFSGNIGMGEEDFADIVRIPFQSHRNDMEGKGIGERDRVERQRER